MEISINVPALIDRAKRESGMTLGQMAKEMHKSQTRFSEWLSGKAEPGTDEIAYLADKAKLPILDTVQALKPSWAHVWARAAEQIKEVRKL
jgi:transcriptional regulator with XRE-family HTH domain